MKNLLHKIFSIHNLKNQSQDSLKFLIVGLGNIGKEYENTRHNIGFNVLNSFTEVNKLVFESARYADTVKHRYKGKILVLIKPTTFMNLSGKAIRYWLQKENIPVEQLLVICDDVALPFGTLRMKSKGGDGGHNGLIDIIAQLGTDQFARLRFGIGNNFAKGQQVKYVLGKWAPDEMASLPQRINVSLEMIKSFVTIGIDKTMTTFNNK